MLGAGAAPRFYHAFYRWSSIIAPKNHVARSHRLSLGQSRRLGTLRLVPEEPTEPKTDDYSDDSHNPVRVRRVVDLKASTLPPTMEKERRSGQIRYRPTLREQEQQDELGNEQTPEYIRLMRRDVINKSPARRAQISKTCRSLMRHVPSSVVVVTSRSAVGDTSRTTRTSLSRARAMTVSSFTTVSMDPSTIVSFNIKVPSKTWDAILSLQQLRVHFLATSKLGATIADIFSKNHGSEAFEKAIQLGLEVGIPGPYTTSWNSLGGFGNKTVVEKYNFKRRSTNTGEVNHSTVLRGRSIYATLDCKLLEDKCVYIHDHVIVVAEVFGVDRAFLSDDQAYLSYFDGYYRRASARIDLEDDATKSAEPSVEINDIDDSAEPLLRELAKRGTSPAEWTMPNIRGEGNGGRDGQNNSSSTGPFSGEPPKEESQSSPEPVNVADGQKTGLKEGGEEGSDAQEMSASGEEDKSRY